MRWPCPSLASFGDHSCRAAPRPDVSAASVAGALLADPDFSAENLEGRPCNGSGRQGRENIRQNETADLSAMKAGGCDKNGAGEGNRTLVFSLEEFRQLNTFNARSDRSSQNPSLDANGFSVLSERREGGRAV